MDGWMDCVIFTSGSGHLCDLISSVHSRVKKLNENGESSFPNDWFVKLHLYQTFSV